MRIRFWGTRGSIPKPGPDTIRYGGNTSCVEVRTASGALILLDCGTGAHAFGQALLAEQDGPRRGHVLHQPHALGPHPGPAVPGAAVRPELRVGRLWPARPRPVDPRDARRPDAVHLLSGHDRAVRREGATTTTSARAASTSTTCASTAHYMNHPALTLGYRIEADGASIVYATDHEPHSPAARARRAAAAQRPTSATTRRSSPAPTC